MRDFARNEVVMIGHIVQQLSSAHSHTIQTDWTTHVVMDLPSRFVNHACGGSMVNVGIVVLQSQALQALQLQLNDDHDDTANDTNNSTNSQLVMGDARAGSIIMVRSVNQPRLKLSQALQHLDGWNCRKSP